MVNKDDEVTVATDLRARLSKMYEHIFEAPEQHKDELADLLAAAQSRGDAVAAGLARRNDTYLKLMTGDMQDALSQILDAWEDLGGVSSLGLEDDLVADRASIAYQVAAIYIELGSYESCFVYGRYCNQLARLADHSRWIAWSHEILGRAFMAIGDQQRAEQEFRTSYDGFREIGHGPGIVRAAMFLGEIAAEAQDIELALTYFDCAYTTEDVPAEIRRGALNAKASILISSGSLEDASRTLDEIDTLGSTLGGSLFDPEVETSRADMDVANGDLDAAIARFLAAWTHSKEHGRLPEMLTLCKRLSNTYEAMGLISDALLWAREYQSVREELFSMENEQAVRNLQIEMAVERSRSEVAMERQKNAEIEKILLNILPKEIADQLRTTGAAEPVFYPSATVLFTDFVSFTSSIRALDPQELVTRLHAYFEAFDEICTRWNVEKLKTIGDAYMAASGVPVADPDNAFRAVRAAIDIRDESARIRAEIGDPDTWSIRIGLHTGPVVAGVVGNKKFAYDIWGDTVNRASRMESASKPDRILCTEATAQAVGDRIRIEPFDVINAKGIGGIQAFEVVEVLA